MSQQTKEKKQTDLDIVGVSITKYRNWEREGKMPLILKAERVDGTITGVVIAQKVDRYQMSRILTLKDQSQILEIGQLMLTENFLGGDKDCLDLDTDEAIALAHAASNAPRQLEVRVGKV